MEKAQLDLNQIRFGAAKMSYKLIMPVFMAWAIFVLITMQIQKHVGFSRNIMLLSITLSLLFSILIIIVSAICYFYSKKMQIKFIDECIKMEKDMASVLLVIADDAFKFVKAKAKDEIEHLQSEANSIKGISSNAKNIIIESGKASLREIRKIQREFEEEMQKLKSDNIVAFLNFEKEKDSVVEQVENKILDKILFINEQEKEFALFCQERIIKMLEAVKKAKQTLYEDVIDHQVNVEFLIGLKKCL